MTSLRENEVSEQELLPCPFCGCDALAGEHKFTAWQTASYGVGCENCHIDLCGFSTPQEAAENWNRRPTHPAAGVTCDLCGEQMTAEFGPPIYRAAGGEMGEADTVVCQWIPGLPKRFYAEEWFIAKLKDGRRAVLRALPEEYSHQYTTADATYFTKDWVVAWMQFPDSQYKSAATPVAAGGVVVPRKLSNLAIAGVAVKHFGNPIPPAAYAFARELLDAPQQSAQDKDHD